MIPPPPARRRSSDTFMGGGPDAPGYRSTCPAQIPATPRPSLQQDGHRSPWQKKQLSFQRGSPGGVGGPGSPGLSWRSSAVLPAPPSQGPPLPIADMPHLDPRPSVASQRPGDPSWPRRRRRRDSPWFSCFLLLPSLLSSLLCLRDPPMRKNKNEQTEHPEH